MKHYDILVAGGGINGVAIARDAAGRGARVLLVEKDDLAAHTSSASTKLIHGGLRYLEQYEFRLVGESLAERERMMQAAPHLIRPLSFVLPHERSMRPRWMMQAGLFLYDRLGGKSRLPRSRSVKLASDPMGAVLKGEVQHGYLYSDCWGDDSRLVVANALDAAERGATIMTQTRLGAAQVVGGQWQAQLHPAGGTPFTVSARAIVNATGSWAADFARAFAPKSAGGSLRMIKGSHLVTRKLYEGDHAFLLQNNDGRVIFTIPYEGNFTLVGTTDVDWAGSPDKVEVDSAEIAYLCKAVSDWFRTPLIPEDVVSTYAGVRPLYDDESDNPSKISRDYVLKYDKQSGAPFLSVFGGKITTHRALGERAADMLQADLPHMATAWTATATLPGGDAGPRGLAGVLEDIAVEAPFLDPATVKRLGQSYGTRFRRILKGARSIADLGRDFGGGLSQAEVDYLLREEWATTAEDILWRRSKLGLHIPADRYGDIAAYIAQKSRTLAQALAQ